MTSTNLNIILTNAVCCTATLAAKVSKLYSIGDKCADAELAKLKLLNDYIETLRCYKIDAINSKFRYRTLYDAAIFRTLSNPLRTYTITVNGVSQSLPGDGIKTRFEIISDLLGLFPNIISYIYNEDPNTSNPRKNNNYAYLDIEADCDVTEINYSTYITATGALNSSIDLVMYQTGVCTVTNCLTDEEYQTLIEYVMSTCDICECQLNQ